MVVRSGVSDTINRKAIVAKLLSQSEGTQVQEPNVVDPERPGSTHTLGKKHSKSRLQWKCPSANAILGMESQATATTSDGMPPHATATGTKEDP
jgi:hypothetical protein